MEWRYTESGVKVRLVFPSQVILQATEQHTKQEDGVNPKNYTSEYSSRMRQSHAILLAIQFIAMTDE